MATEFTQDLEAELRECRVALQGQAQVMLDLLLQFETRLQERLAAAEERIAALQAECDNSPVPSHLRSLRGERQDEVRGEPTAAGASGQGRP